jgi:membrane dipeptidase
MIKSIIISGLLAFSLSVATAQRYKKIHSSAIVVDTHNDFLSVSLVKNVSFDQSLKGVTHSDLQRMKEGGLDVQVFSIFCDEQYGKGTAFSYANREIDSLYAIVGRNPSSMSLVTNPLQLQKALTEKKFAAMMGVEGGHMIEDNITYLDSFYKRGVRYMTLTWNNSTSWASSAMDETLNADSLPHKGLNDFGKQVVKRMNELGMIVDISHVGEQTFYDALAISTKPVIASHSCAWTLNHVFRNLKDDQIRAVGKNNGVIQLNFFSGFVDSNFFKRSDAFMATHKTEWDSLKTVHNSSFVADMLLFEKYADEVNNIRPPLSMLLDHLDYIVKMIGVDHVGLGSDFDGINSAPKELDDVTNMPVITRELLKRGYKKKDIRKILGENFIRVFKANSAG